MSDWKIIHGFEDYEVSRHGQVRRATAGRGTTIGQIIKPHTQTSTGYPDVRLRKDGRTYSMAIHRLVAAAFLGNKPEGQQIRHLDGNRLNASAENLRFGTSIEKRYRAATLTDADLYDVRFLTIRGANLTERGTVEGVHADRLAAVFTEQTGFDTHI